MHDDRTTTTPARAIAERFAPPPSRREVIAGGAVAAVAVLASSVTEAPAATGDDDALAAIALEIEQREETLNRPGCPEEEIESGVDEQGRDLARMAEISAATPRGMASKVRALRAVTQDGLEDLSAKSEIDLLDSLFRDIERQFSNT